MADGLNANPTVFAATAAPRRPKPVIRDDEDDECMDVEPIDNLECFDLLRDVNDPEHPLTLEQLRVIEPDNITVDDANSRIRVQFTPTIPHCSMATLIGLCLRVKLLRSLPPRFKADILVTPGSHASEVAVNKQLNDKERVAAALENPRLLEVVDQCLRSS